MEVQLRALQILLDRLSDPSELSLAREAYHAVSTGQSQFWGADRPKDVERLREIFIRVFDVS